MRKLPVQSILSDSDKFKRKILTCHFLNLFNIENMDITLRTKTHLYEKDNHVFYNITGTSIDYTLDGLKLRLDNLFDGVKVLGMFMLAKWLQCLI